MALEMDRAPGVLAPAVEKLGKGKNESSALTKKIINKNKSSCGQQ
jgi:hypothetical protein